MTKAKKESGKFDVSFWPVEQIELQKLIPYHSNPRTITAEKFERLKKDIQEMGFTNPLRLNNDKTVLGGHQRLKALIDMGAPPETLIPCAVSPKKLTEKQIQKHIVKDNLAAGDWDFDILANDFEFEELKDWGMNEKDLKIQSFEPEEDGIRLDEKTHYPVNCPVCNHAFEVDGSGKIKGS